MMAYVGQARGSKLIAQLVALGFGEMTVREEFPPRRTPWVFDNGAFKDWTAAVPFQTPKYEKALDRLAVSPLRPDFIVAPDIVASGLESLRFSESWAERLSWLGLPVYLVLQNGMREADVLAAMAPFAGLFVGGTLDWKLRTSQTWVEFGHLHGRRVHIGRMGTTERVRAARRWGADSIDSSLPLWSVDNLRRFVAGFHDAIGDLLDGDEGRPGETHGAINHMRSAFLAPQKKRAPINLNAELFSW
jgi:hypothetical protein